MSYAEEVAKMPEYGDDITMDNLIRAYLVNAEKGMGATSAFLRPAFADGRTDADLLRYVMHLHTWLWQAEVADLLMRIQAIAPAVDIDGIAATFVETSQSGDYYPEMLWEWLTEREIDASRLFDEGRREALATLESGAPNHADRSTT